MMNRICLVALIGLPAVGKSTLCHYLMQMKSLPFNVLHLCYDNFINYNSEIPSQYKVQRINILKKLNEVILQLKKSNNLPTELTIKEIQYKNHQCNDIIILCDDNHYYRSMRYKLFQLAREHSTRYCQIYIKCCIKLALEQNNFRCGVAKVPNNVIVQMCNRLEVPNIDNKWEENTLIVENSNVSEICNEIIDFLKSLYKHVHPLQITASKSTTPQSTVHELDLLIRKRIKTIIDSKEEQNKKLLGKKLNDKRKEILKHFQMNLRDNQNDIHLVKYVDKLNNF